MSDKGKKNIADNLRKLGNQLAEYANPNFKSFSQTQIEKLSEKNLQAYEQFLKQILLAITHSNGDAEVVYSLLAANTDKLNSILVEILRHWAINTFEEAEANVAEYIAAAIFDFGYLIEQFSIRIMRIISILQLLSTKLKNG